MIPAEFHILLVAASFVALRAAKRFVSHDLPVDAFQYWISLNQSHDAHATDAEVLYPGDEGRIVEGLSEQEAVSLLCRDGRCPEWIDVSVEAVGDGITIFRLVCCGRYTDDRQKMYYSQRGLGPFGIKSPDLPAVFKEGDRFALPAV